MPKVWNKRDPKCPADAVYVGRPSLFGNPFIIPEHGTREEVIHMFEIHARKKIAHDPVFRRLVTSLHERELVCWCAPKACHADVLVKLAEELSGF
jgi:hypothetical protein